MFRSKKNQDPGRGALTLDFANRDDGRRIVLQTMASSADRVEGRHSFVVMAFMIGLVVTILSGLMLVWLGTLRNRFSNEQVASVMALNDQVRAETARANERAAELLLQARQADLERNRSQIELERTKLLSSERRLSADQRSKILSALKGVKSTVMILASGSDREAQSFANDIARTLNEAGMSVSSNTSIAPLPITGLGLSMSQAGKATPLYIALQSAGLKVVDLPEKDPVMLAVGAKPGF